MITQPLSSNMYDRVRLNALTQTFRRIVLCSLVIFLAFGLFHPAAAQSEAPGIAQAVDTMNALHPASSNAAIASPTWQSNFDAQAAHMLRNADNPDTRSVVLNDVIVVATQHPNAIDFSTTVGALLQVCEDAPNKQQRLMAVQALHAIGTENVRDRRYRRAMERLYHVMQDESSDQVRSVAASALHDFYATGE